MRKLKGILLILVCTLLLSGCQSNTEKTMTCSKKMNQNGIKANFNYNITYKGKYVTKVESIEEVVFDDNETLQETKKEIENIAASYKNIKYYDIEITTNENTLSTKTTIDYEHIDTKEKVDSTTGITLDNGKLSIENLKKQYNKLGMKCK